MAKKKGNVPGAVVHGVIGTIPLVGGAYGGYRGAKKATGSKGASIGGAVAGTLIPGVGTIGGAYHGYNTKAHVASGKAKNPAPRMNAGNNAVARSKPDSSANSKNVVMHTRTKGRVGKK